MREGDNIEMLRIIGILMIVIIPGLQHTSAAIQRSLTALQPI